MFPNANRSHMVSSRVEHSATSSVPGRNVIALSVGICRDQQVLVGNVDFPVMEAHVREPLQIYVAFFAWSYGDARVDGGVQVASFSRYPLPGNLQWHPTIACEKKQLK